MAGNKNSGRRKGGRDFAPRVRSIVDRCIEELQASGDADKLMKQALREDFIGTLQKVSAYAPKQIEAQVTSLSPEDWLTLMAEQDVSQPESTESANTVPGQFH